MRRVIVPISALVLFFLLIQLRGADTQAVGSCPALVRNAIARVEQICSGTGRNQICYAHSAMLAEYRPEITDVLFSTPGDVTEIYNLNRLQLFPLNLESEEWGMALMRVQANLPDSLPGQNVLFLLFGDVELSPELSLASNVSTPPVSAFRLRSGVGAPQCDTAPPNGLLIQTPHGVGRVELTINGVDVSLGSTVFFTAQENEYLTVSTLEGSALIHTEEGESLALAGSQVQIPLNANLEPAAPPMLPQPYQVEALDQLPLEALERSIEVHPPLTEDEIEIVHQAILDGEAEVLLPEVTPEAPDCPGNSCTVQLPDVPANTGNANSGNSGQGNSNSGNSGQGGGNPGQGGGSPPANPGNPGQGGGNPGQGAGNPGQGGGNPGQGGGSPPANPGNPGQGGENPGQGGGSPPANPGNPGQGGGNPDQGAGNSGQGGGNPGQGGGNPPANPGQGGGPPDNPGQGGGNPGQGGDNPGQGGGNPGQGGGGQPTPTPTG